MEPIALGDLLGRERYEAAREAIRRRIIEYKRTRRAAVGDRLSFVFEDRATVWYQIQEMLWVERTTDLDAVRAELAVYNQALPDAAELSATLFIEITDDDRIRDELARLVGIDEHVALEIGEARVPGVFEAGRQTEEKLSAVQYVRFPLDAQSRARLAEGDAVVLVVEHPNYRARGVLPTAVRTSVAADVLDPEAATRALQRVRDGI